LRARTWWQAPRACGPSAPSAEKARPASPISGALVGESGTAHRLSSTTGARAAPKDHAEPDCPEHPPATPGLAVWSRVPEAPRAFARSGGLTRRSRRDPDCEQPRPRRAAPLASNLTAVLRRERGAGLEIASNDASVKRSAFRARDAPNIQAYNPLFKERVPELHVANRDPAGYFTREHRRVSRFMALHSLRNAEARAVRRRFRPTSAREPTFL
jgi:hypothetical protein